MEFPSNTVFLIALFSFILFTLSIFLFGYLSHFCKYIFPYLQFPSVFMLTLAILLQTTFFLGSAYPNKFSIIEFVMFLIMSLMFYLFHHQFIPKILTIEAINLCNSGCYSPIKTAETAIIPQLNPRNPNSEENIQESIEENYSKNLRKEIEKTGFSGLRDSEFQNKCILFIISKIRRFQHLKLMKCLGDRKSETEREAKSILTRLQRNVRVFCIFMPAIFLVVEVMKPSIVEKKASLVVVLNLLKTFITIHFMHESNFFMSNIMGFMKSSTLESRFNCIRVLFMLLMIQNVLVSAIGLRGERDMSINFAVMSIENCILCYFWIKYYGVKACELFFIFIGV